MICTCKERSHLVSMKDGAWIQPIHQCEKCFGCYHDPKRDKEHAAKYPQRVFTKKKK